MAAPFITICPFDTFANVMHFLFVYCMIPYQLCDWSLIVLLQQVYDNIHPVTYFSSRPSLSPIPSMSESRIMINMEKSNIHNKRYETLQ